jgi:hypothetical protein
MFDSVSTRKCAHGKYMDDFCVTCDLMQKVEVLERSIGVIKDARDRLSVYGEKRMEDAVGQIVRVDKKSLFQLLDSIDAQ